MAEAPNVSAAYSLKYANQKLDNKCVINPCNAESKNASLYDSKLLYAK